VISVIICTHNPRRDYFARCLDGLAAQTLPRDAWELVVVDNASAPGSVAAHDPSWHPNARYVREDTLGLTPARLRGIRESRGDLLVFVDDDNVLDPDYLETAGRIATERGFLGSWSGQCRPAFDEPPPEWTRRYWGNLVIREFDHDAWSNLPRLADTMPCGAGLCLRRRVAEHYAHLHQDGQRGVQLDRVGGSLLSGGDNDLAGCACHLGLGVALIPTLRLTHLIPPERLTLDYLERLAEGIHYSGALLDSYYGVVREQPSLARRMINWMRLPFLTAEDARIARAVERGRTAAARQLANADQKHHRNR
jgi:hypothetical protein